MIPPVARTTSRQYVAQPFRAAIARRADALRHILTTLLALLLAAAPALAHDIERTQVVLTFARDGSFTLDVSADPNWLKLRLPRYDGNFVDRIVLFVDGHEVRPRSIEFVPATAEGLATYRMRGRFPTDARTLRWYYGMVVDPYPLAIQRADGRVVVEEIAGDAWSGAIDLTGQFRAPILSERSTLLLVALVAAPLAVRFRLWRKALALRSQP
jgi:hypothetical protein